MRGPFCWRLEGWSSPACLWALVLSQYLTAIFLLTGGSARMGPTTRAEARTWAYEEFGHANLGDPRRTARFIRMATSLAEHPGGKVLDVSRSDAEPQGAYDFLSNQRVLSAAILESVQVATARRCKGESWVHVIVDGTSLRLTDLRRAKGFGAAVLHKAVGKPGEGRRSDRSTVASVEFASPTSG